MVNNPFTVIKTTANYVKGHLIQWWIDPTFAEPAPYTFQLYIYQDAAVKEPIAIKNLGEAFFAIDDTHIRRGHFDDSYMYRIKLTASNDKSFFSKPISVGFDGALSRHKYLNAAEMVRKEWVRMQYTGQLAWLLKRKMYSPAALNEVDPVTGEPIIDTANGSYGVGHVKGYYDPVLFKFSLEDFQQSMTFHPEGRGPTYKENIKFRTAAYPYLDNKDIIVTQEDRRYLIDTISGALYPGTFFMILQTCEAHILPNTDTVYSIEMPSMPESNDP